MPRNSPFSGSLTWTQLGPAAVFNASFIWMPLGAFERRGDYDRTLRAALLPPGLASRRVVEGATLAQAERARSGHLAYRGCKRQSPNGPSPEQRADNKIKSALSPLECCEIVTVWFVGSMNTICYQ